MNTVSKNYFVIMLKPEIIIIANPESKLEPDKIYTKPKKIISKSKKNIAIKD